MKNLFKSLAFVALAATSFTACNDDCKDIVCGEFGTCNEGICDCLPNYEKDDEGLCSVLERAKFTGNYNVTSNCSSAFNSSISNGTELNEIIYANFLGGVNSQLRLVGVVSGNTVTIARTQDVDGTLFFYEGEGKIENGELTMNMIITEEEIVIDADGNETYEVVDTYNCDYIFTK